MSEIPQVDLKIPSGGTLVLQLLLHNQSTESLFLHPQIKDWVVDREDIISSLSYVEPICTVLAGGEKKSQKMRLEIPSELKPGQILKNWLQFPGIQEAGIPVNIEIIESDKNLRSITDLFLKIDLPFADRNSKLSPILGLMSGLMEFDRIPMRWLVVEILVKLCQIGEESSKSPAGSELLYQLHATNFFKVGVSASKSIQFPRWIAKTLSNMEPVIKNNQAQASLFYLWESWLFSLAEVDLGSGEIASTIEVPPFLAEELVKELGNDSDRWFAYLMLGLAKISPSIAINLQNIATETPLSSGNLLTDRSLQSIYNLAIKLSGLDLLPASWLVMEILLLVTGKGREYLATEAGTKLLTKLRRTHFFKNGITAFTSSQFPRWLAISREAANTYYESLGVPNCSRGVIYYWENWLGNLGKNQAVYSANIVENLLAKQWELDAEEWFGAIVLGLVQISPRIATQIQNIADRALDNFPPILQHPVALNNMLDEANSLPR
ncbi:MAG: hypothetical protein MUE44_16585 [Oscillatoriaceae cyanobacterium Prado104]|jgi:hypothetical protein|nr:hypothetical protein [Oscillatoriaceae cyanobacterium Prado104]